MILAGAGFIGASAVVAPRPAIMGREGRRRRIVMEARGPLAALSHLAHKHLIWLVVGSYALAALCPGPGLWVRGVALGEARLFGERAGLSLPVVMLAVLLFNAGLGARRSGLAG